MTWNCRTLGLSDEARGPDEGTGMNLGGRAALLASALKEQNVHILALQEGRYRSSATFRCGGYTIFAASGSRGARGSQIWISDKHASSVVAAHPHSDRIVSCLMRFGGALLAVVCIHAPRIVECSA
eukprot:15467290-Alexandrium_andersonii.AAC.1